MKLKDAREKYAMPLYHPLVASHSKQALWFASLLTFVNKVHRDRSVPTDYGEVQGSITVFILNVQ